MEYGEEYGLWRSLMLALLVLVLFIAFVLNCSLQYYGSIKFAVWTLNCR